MALVVFNANHATPHPLWQCHARQQMQVMTMLPVSAAAMLMR
jgi:hypothetical protein